MRKLPSERAYCFVNFVRPAISSPVSSASPRVISVTFSAASESCGMSCTDRLVTIIASAMTATAPVMWVTFVFSLCSPPTIAFFEIKFVFCVLTLQKLYFTYVTYYFLHEICYAT